MFESLSNDLCKCGSAGMDTNLVALQQNDMVYISVNEHNVDTIIGNITDSCQYSIFKEKYFSYKIDAVFLRGWKRLCRLAENFFINLFGMCASYICQTPGVCLETYKSGDIFLTRFLTRSFFI